jgi:hypothetical protein
MSDSVCIIAEQLTAEDRCKQYGHPSINMAEIAGMWSIILRTKVTAEQVALCNIATKVCRQMHQSKRDNLIDICGYAKVADTVLQHETQNQKDQSSQNQSHQSQGRKANQSQRAVQVQKGSQDS